jgi:hypothetical protein
MEDITFEFFDNEAPLVPASKRAFRGKATDKM